MLRLIPDIIAWAKDLMTPKWVGSFRKLPTYLYAIPIAAIPATWVPLAAVFWYRSDDAKLEPRLHMFLDMDNQPKLKTQRLLDYQTPMGNQASSVGVVPGTVARGDLRNDDHYYFGAKDYQPGPGGTMAPVFAETYPEQVLNNEGKLTEPFVYRGRQRYQIYCMPCHGEAGDGQGTILIKTRTFDQNWTAPANLLEERIVKQSVGKLYNTVSNGQGNMYGYKYQIDVEDRWAIVAYLRAMQLAEYSRETDQPEEDK